MKLEYEKYYDPNDFWMFYGPEILMSDPINILEMERWSLSKIENFHNEQLEKMIYYVKKHVPFYRDIFNDLPFSQMPYTSKQEIMSSPETYLSNYDEKYEVITKTSSGSTGKPFTYSTNFLDAHTSTLLYFYNFVINIGGVDLFNGERVISLNYAYPNKGPLRSHISPIYPKKIKTYVDENEANWFSYSAMAYSNRDELFLEIHQKAKDSNITTLIGSPSLTCMYVDFCNSKDFKLPNLILTYGEKVLHTQREKYAINKIKHLDFFHSPDGSCIFYQCEYGNYHHATLKSFPENYTYKGKDVLISTSLINTVQPFLRYANGDFCKINKTENIHKCPCGRHGYSVNKIDGRSLDHLLVGKKYIDPNSIFSIFSGDREIGNWTIEQYKNNIILVYLENQDEDSKLRIESKLRFFGFEDVILFKDISLSQQDHISKKRFVKRIDRNYDEVS